MSELEGFLSTSTIVWHSSTKLINKYGRAQLNALYKENKISIANGLNCKVIKYEVKI